MYATEREFREARLRRIAYVVFGVSMLLSAIICSVVLFLSLTAGNPRRLVGNEGDFVIGQVSEVPVKRLELTQLLPNKPNWSQDIIFVIKQPDSTYRAYLGLDPQSGCKLNWRNTKFVDSCSQASYSSSGRNVELVQTLNGPLNATQAAEMIELPVQVESGKVYVVDQRVRRDRR